MMNDGINLLITEDEIMFDSEADYETFLCAMRVVEDVIGRASR